MNFSILSITFISVFLASCDEQKQTEAINKTIEIKTAPETATKKPTQQKTRPPLILSIDNLSIDNLPLNQQKDDHDIFNIEPKPTVTHSDTFETLSRDQEKFDINLSGKLLTDEEKVDNKEYLDSIDGVQINVEGSFE